MSRKKLFFGTVATVLFLTVATVGFVNAQNQNVEVPKEVTEHEQKIKDKEAREGIKEAEAVLKGNKDKSFEGKKDKLKEKIPKTAKLEKSELKLFGEVEKQLKLGRNFAVSEDRQVVVNVASDENISMPGVKFKKTRFHQIIDAETEQIIGVSFQPNKEDVEDLRGQAEVKNTPPTQP